MRYFITLLIVGLSMVSLPAAAFDLSSQVTSFQLKNGMQWLVVKRQQAPVFTGIVMVRVGGVDEESGKTGLAHMFEHMAFKGSQRIGTRSWAKEKRILKEMERVGEELTKLELSPDPDAKRITALREQMQKLQQQADQYQIKNEVWEVLMRNGAKELNAYTSKDLTAFYASMPSDRLELWARMTAEMIFHPVFREFYTERSVVAEERRTAVENDPEGALVEELLSKAFVNGPYGWHTIGLEQDVRGLTIEDARAFHRKHYVASNMVGVLVGDLDPRQAKRVIERVFGNFPKRKPPEGPKRGGMDVGGVEAQISYDAAPSVVVAFHKPTLPDPKEYVFDVMTSLLCDGRSSRLEKRLIYDQRLAKDVYCSDGFPGSRFENLMLLWVEPLKGVSLKRIVHIVDDEVRSLREKPVTEEELQRTRKRAKSRFVFALESNEQLAEGLARFFTIFGDWRYLATYPEHIAEVTAKDIERVAQEYLVPNNRVIVERVRSR